MVSEMLEGHLQKVSKITLNRVPSQVTELLGMEMVNTTDPDGLDKPRVELTVNQMASVQREWYREMPEVDMRLVHKERILFSPLSSHS